MRLARFTLPFKVFYTEIVSGVLIHAVAGDHQLPDYWLSRVSQGEC